MSKEEFSLGRLVGAIADDIQDGNVDMTIMCKVCDNEFSVFKNKDCPYCNGREKKE